MNRNFLPETLLINSWDDLKPYYQNLKNRDINSKADFEKWLQDLSELESVVGEDIAWRYIKMTCNTADEQLEKSYLHFVSEIQPHIAPEDDALNKKLANSPYVADFESDMAYHIYFRNVKGAIELYREENIPLYTELQTMAQKYASINGAMSVEIDGEEMTLQKAANQLLLTDRDKRKSAWQKIAERRLKDKDQLDELFTEMVKKRHQVALNAGFENFRDYMFKSLGRYDYTPEDCFKFHEAIKTKVVPLLKKQYQQRADSLKLDILKPWDLSVDRNGNPPLKVFADGKDLLEKSVRCFSRLDSYFSDCLNTMSKKGYLDLESRLGKAPGGYNYPLPESNIPFIFMNASGNLRDVETMVHEGGHAIHSFLTADLPLNAFKTTTSEVAELASMSMELISMEAWDEFLPDSNDLNRAKTEQLEGIIQTLPWIAIIDKFQHWIYENPLHTSNERRDKWLEISSEFGTGLVDYSDMPNALDYSWHKQLHLFEVPFYYVEYGFAQLGAIGVWKQFVENKTVGLNNYKAALTLGNTKPIPEIYKTAGVTFDFSEQFVGGLMDFVNAELTA